MKKKKRILLVWDRLGDYHHARAEALRAMGQVYGERGEQVEFEVFTADLAASDELYQWAPPAHPNHRVLSRKAATANDVWRRSLRFAWLLLRYRIDAVGLAGWANPSYLALIVLARVLGRRVVLFAESWYGKRDAKNRAKALFLWVFAHGLFVSGQRAYDFFRRTLRLQKLPMQQGYSAVHNQHFAPGASKVLHISQYPHILCVARFAREKNLERLVEAFLHSRAAKRYHLKLIGSGPQMTMLRERFQQRSEVILQSWASYQELPMEYQQASAFVLASTFEPWGLVVNEAAAAGLPLLLSRHVGCVPELAGPANSLLFDPYRTSDITHCFDQFAALGAVQLQQMGLASRQMVAPYGCEQWATKFVHLAFGQQLTQQPSQFTLPKQPTC